MPSKFGWIDFSEKERRQMLDVVHLFSERDTRDELGIGTIRDAFADYFFPGTSTIQTRVKYFLLIPWIYLDLEKKQVKSAQIATRARREEIRLIDTLLKNGSSDGVIGIEAKKGLMRLPSNVYWIGLASWGIRRFPGSQDQYHRYLDTYYKKASDGFGREADDELPDYNKSANWHPGFPQPPEDLWNQASLDLTYEEAIYLKECVLLNHADSLLAELLKKSKNSKANFPWEHPTVGSVHEPLWREVEHAWNFSEVIHGAALLYNLMLAREADNEGRILDYENRMEKWKGVIQGRKGTLRKWYKHISGFWSCEALRDARIPLATHSFVDRWFRRVLDSPGIGNLMDDSLVCSEIKNRESFLKRGRARLSNKSALSRWRGESGTAQLNYRWNVTSTLVADIFQGLQKERQVA